VLISDVGMPDEDGYSLIRHIRARPPDTSVPKTARGYFQVYLRKPAEPSDVVAAVALLAARGAV